MARTSAQRVADMRVRRKEWLSKFKKPCCFCGEDEHVCIDFHHIDPNDKSFNISSNYYCRSKADVEAEINKCVCLCSNCHRKVHAGILELT
jgi:hypothetical protein